MNHAVTKKSRIKNVTHKGNSYSQKRKFFYVPAIKKSNWIRLGAQNRVFNCKFASRAFRSRYINISLQASPYAGANGAAS
jgi:hypothetical protein